MDSITTAARSNMRAMSPDATDSRPDQLRGGERKELSSNGGYDLVTFFDCLHDMGDPIGAAKHVLSSLKPDGTWMIVEPFAHDIPKRITIRWAHLLFRLDDALHARFACPGSRSGTGRASRRGAHSRCRDASRIHAVPQSSANPFNLVYEARA